MENFIERTSRKDGTAQVISEAQAICEIQEIFGGTSDAEIALMLANGLAYPTGEYFYEITF